MDANLYTDGHGIKVTTNQFIVGNTQYLVEGITNARMNLRKASKTPVVLLILLGIGGIITGVLHMYSGVDMDIFYVGSILITPNRLAAFTGGILLMAGIIFGILQHDRYAVRITTAEGEKEPVISTKKDYIRQIVAALQEALRLK